MSRFDFNALPKSPYLLICHARQDSEAAEEIIEEIYLKGWNVCTGSEREKLQGCEAVVVLLISGVCDDRLVSLLDMAKDKDIICCNTGSANLPDELKYLTDCACEISYGELDCFLADTDMINFGRRKA